MGWYCDSKPSRFISRILLKRTRTWFQRDGKTSGKRGHARQGRRLGPQVWNLFRFRAFKRLKPSAAASTRHCGHRHLVLGLCSLLFASMALSCYGVQACRLPALKPAKCSAAASTRHCGHRHLVLEPCSLPFASMALSC